MEFFGLKVPSLLDSGSMVMLIHAKPISINTSCLYCMVRQKKLAEAHSCCFSYLLPIIRTCQFRSISMLTFPFSGFSIPSVGFLVVKDPNSVLEPQPSTQLLGVIRCNLIRLGCEEFGKVFGFEAFETFKCPR